MSLQQLAKEFLDSLNTLDSDEKVIAITKKLQDSVISGNQASMQRDLGSYVNHLSDIIIDKASLTVKSESFKSLTDKDKADLIRDYLSLGVKVGYEKTATATSNVYQELLKSSGLTFNPVVGSLDTERLKGSVAVSIEKAIEDDEKLESSMRESFSQIIKTGNRDTITQTSEKVKSRTGKFLLAKRVTSSTKPCDFCLLNSEEWFKVADDDSQFHRFHDHCKCRLETKIADTFNEDNIEDIIDLIDIDFDEIDLDDF